MTRFSKVRKRRVFLFVGDFLRKIVKRVLEFFSLVRKERKGQKEESIPLLNSFCRLAATSANKVPRPSDNCLTTATGSKRPRADSDSLLCHVGLWRTSRLNFGCGCGKVPALNKSWRIASLLLWGIDRFAEHVCWRRRDGGIGACTLTDEEPLKRTAKINSIRAMLAP